MPRLLGLKRGAVILVPYSPEWAGLFRIEKRQLERALRELAIDIQHIGSTAVLGLQSKPVLDIGVAVEEICDVERCVEPLKGLGYSYLGDRDRLGNHLFVKGPEDQRTHCLHVVALTDPQWQEYLAFRDCLLANEQVRQDYERLKVRLASQYPNDRESYVNGKTEFIRAVVEWGAGNA